MSAVTPLPAARRPYLRIEHLTKQFGPFVALNDISLDIDDGEFVCFLGPSGCGKTTLLRAIAGLDIQTRGCIEQAGRDISALPPQGRDFGIVFQSYALFPNMTVARNIAYGLEGRRNKAAIRARVAELLALVGLPEQGDKYPAQLSGGQQQRVALARAVATAPGLLLLDEPLSALDAKVRARLRHEIRALQQRLGLTTIMVTHDQEEALTMADRIVVMNHGVIEQVGTPLDIYREPATAFVADFIGAMNFLPVTVGAATTVRLAGYTLHCTAHSLPVEQAATLAIRPEDIVLCEGPERSENVLAVRLAGLEFLGSFYRAELTAPAVGAQGLRADFSINLLRRTGIQVGADVQVYLPPERLRVFPAGSRP